MLIAVCKALSSVPESKEYFASYKFELILSEFIMEIDHNSGFPKKAIEPNGNKKPGICLLCDPNCPRIEGTRSNNGGILIYELPLILKPFIGLYGKGHGLRPAGICIYPEHNPLYPVVTEGPCYVDFANDKPIYPFVSKGPCNVDFANDKPINQDNK